MLLSLWPVIIRHIQTPRQMVTPELYDDSIPTRLPFDAGIERRRKEDESLLIILL